MATIFEYDQWIDVSDGQGLNAFLQSIWNADLFPESEVSEEELVDSHFQPFLQISGNKVRARNYVGFIQYEGKIIEIFPKVFRSNKGEVGKSMMLRHIFYWLSYCRKWEFPFTVADLSNNSIESFPELIAYLMARQINDCIREKPFMKYEMVEEALETPRGQINFSRYITNQFSRGQFHRIECDYEPFIYDNRMNQIIKYCCRLLLSTTKLSETVNLLQENISILDEVTDRVCSLRELDTIRLNAGQQEYQRVLDTCRYILSQQMYSTPTHDLSQWCLLLPMEYLFEDFIAGFLEKHYSDRLKIEYQKSDMYLSDEPRVFRLQHDILVTDRRSSRQVIVDTKYKVRDNNYLEDPKRGIYQPDLYQMISYGYKRNCSNTVLLYPNVSQYGEQIDIFIVRSLSGEQINVKTAGIPFWTLKKFTDLESDIKSQFNMILE